MKTVNNCGRILENDEQSFYDVVEISKEDDLELKKFVGMVTNETFETLDEFLERIKK